jgi:L-lactate utilization protein LutC
MKRITTVLKESEVMAVRKAVCIAGAERVVITPLPYRMCGIDMVDIYSDQIAAESDKHVRLDVTADNRRSGSIVSAISRITHAGRIILASRHDMQPKRTA